MIRSACLVGLLAIATSSGVGCSDASPGISVNIAGQFRRSNGGAMRCSSQMLSRTRMRERNESSTASIATMKTTMTVSHSSVAPLWLDRTRS